MKGSPGQVEISLEFERHLGPRFVHGGLKVSFDALQPYSFSSLATWPEGHNYEALVREAIEGVLRERLGSLDRVRVQLHSISWDPINSSTDGLQRAARQVTELAFAI